MSTHLYKEVRYLCTIPKDNTDYEEDKEMDLESVLPYDAVIAQQDYICGELGLPTTITQFRKDAEGSWERIDSQVSAITLRTSCDILRRCINNKGKLCRDCDARYAELFCDLPSGDIVSVLKRRVCEKQLEWISEEGYYASTDAPEVLQKAGHTYIQYRCPMLGYRELMFPIRYAGKILAVFTVGQLSIEGEEDVVLRYKDRFLQAYDYLFLPYLKTLKQAAEKTQTEKIDSVMERYDIEQLRSFLLHKSSREHIPFFPKLYDCKPGMIIPTIKDQLSEEKCKEEIIKICGWLTKLERLLVNEMRNKREAWVRSMLDEALSEFHANANVDLSRSVDEALWRHVQNFTDRLVADCGLASLTVFGSEGTHGKKAEFLKVVAFSPTDGKKNQYMTARFSLKGKIAFVDRPIDSRQHHELFDAIDREIRENVQLKTIVYQPMKEISAASIAMLVEFRDGDLKTSMEDGLIAGLLNLAVLLSSRLTVRFENLAQAQLVKSLRLYKHEIVNLTDGVNRAINDYLGSPYLKEIEDAKIQAVYRDASGTLSMFRFMSENIGILVNKPIPPDKGPVTIYSKVIYKWENIRRVDAREKACDIVYRKSLISVWTDVRYAELVVYNLLTNAVKYAFYGTKIYMHCSNEPAGRHKLSVENYSFSISPEDEERMFDIGFRGEDAIASYPEGSGIGLWIVRTVMELLGGEVSLQKPVCLSDFNVPLLHAYIQNPSLYGADVSSMKYQDAKVAYDALSQQKQKNMFGEEVNGISLIVADYYWRNPPRSQVRKALRTPTYLIRFEVTF